MFRENDEQIKELVRSQQETDRKFQDTDRKFQDTERLVKNLSKNLGELGNRLGEFVEHRVAPAVVRLFQELGIDVHEVHPGIEASRHGEGLEVDLLVVNEGVLIAVECKSKLAREHVDEHLARMDTLKRLLPSYQHHQALGAVAAMVMSESVRNAVVQIPIPVMANFP